MNIKTKYAEDDLVFCLLEDTSNKTRGDFRLIAGKIRTIHIDVHSPNNISVLYHVYTQAKFGPPEEFNVYERDLYETVKDLIEEIKDQQEHNDRVKLKGRNND